MSLTLVTPPAVEPVSLAEAKLHLKVDDHDDNGLIQTLIRAAREYVETHTQRVLITQTWDWVLDAFPCDEVLRLPLAPVASVFSFTYVDTAGATQILSSALYRTDLPTGPHAARGRITPAYGASFPSTRDVTNAVTIRLVCGYGASAASVPASLTAAIKILVAHWYEQRMPVDAGISAEVPLMMDALLWPYRTF